MSVLHESQGQGVFEDLPLLQTLHVSLTATVFCGVEEIRGGREPAGQAVSSLASTNRGYWRIMTVSFSKNVEGGVIVAYPVPSITCYDRRAGALRDRTKKPYAQGLNL